MKSIHMLAWILLIVGGLNWGLVGLFNFNLVAALLGEGSALSRIVYSLVGLAAVMVAVQAMTGRAPVLQRAAPDR